MAHDPSPEDMVFLSTIPAGPGQRRIALAVVVIAAVLFVIGLPFASVQLPEVWAFIPIYESWLVIIDAITAVLLFGQYAILRSRALLVLATGYLFTTAMTTAHALSFPGLFAPTGLFGAGAQTTAWLYTFWKVGFALFIIAYTALKDGKPGAYAPNRGARVGILTSMAFVLVLSTLLTLLATGGERFLPVLMDHNQYAVG